MTSSVTQAVSSPSSRSGVFAAGLALFSMFFGAGDLIWPLILGGSAGDKNLYAMLGLLITGVSLPLLGLVSMLMFGGDYRSFFNRLGKFPGFILLFIIQAILGPIGSIPRLFTLSFATLQPYFPNISLFSFSLIASAMVLLLAYKKQRIIDILGLILTPLLLLTLGAILFVGFMHPPAAVSNPDLPVHAFKNGLSIGYNTLDIIASFIFAPLVLSHFQNKANEGSSNGIAKKMLKSSLIAAALLSIVYIGLTYVASFYTAYLPQGHAPEARLGAISLYLLGPIGGLISAIAVAMACLTTAVPLVCLCGEYIRKDLLKERIGIFLPLLLTLLISAGIANLGFIGIANMLSPILQILCPGLIVLCVLNILHKTKGMKIAKVPVFAMFAISLVTHLFF